VEFGAGSAADEDIRRNTGFYVGGESVEDPRGNLPLEEEIAVEEAELIAANGYK